MVTEDDMQKMSKEELRRYKEQLLTDMLCAIPESLEIDLDAQTLDGNGARARRFICETICRNWLRDWMTLFLFVTMLSNILFFLISAGMSEYQAPVKA